jgi:hypothetical protein
MTKKLSLKEMSPEEKASLQKGFNPKVVLAGKEPINQMTNSVVECHMGEPGVFVTSCGC